MSQTNKPIVVWFQGITCNGNTHSFLSATPTLFNQFTRDFELIYHTSLTNDNNIHQILNNDLKIDFLLVEGAISPDMKYYSLDNSNLVSILNKLASKTKYLINVGSCASFGGVHKKFEQNTMTKNVLDSLDTKLLEDKNLTKINLSGCPIHPTWLIGTMNILNKRGFIEVDEFLRPKEYYSSLSHHGCSRNEYFEWKVEANEFGHKEGCLFYKQGCRGPMSNASCNKILWNDISSKTRAGMPCIGCTESDFPRTNMLETKKNMGIPHEVPLGVSKRAYLGISGVAKSFRIERLHKKLIDYEDC